MSDFLNKDLLQGTCVFKDL